MNFNTLIILFLIFIILIVFKFYINKLDNIEPFIIRNFNKLKQKATSIKNEKKRKLRLNSNYHINNIYNKIR